MKKLFLFILVASLFASCKPEEGKGGLASIGGVVMVQNINVLFEKSGDLYPAVDEDVYISYGDSQIADDKEATNIDGYFEFSYLTKGDYTVFAYSDDSVSNDKSSKLCMSKSVSIENKKDEIYADTLVIYKHVDYDDGNGDVQGSVREIICSGSLILDTLTAVDADVYLQYQNSNEILERVRTDANGNFIFARLVPGKYRVYCLTETQTSAEPDTAVVRNFEITNLELNASVETMCYRNYK